MTSTVHVFPVRDVVGHATDEGAGDSCVCGPDVEYMLGGGKRILHHSLDGREHHEHTHDREDCPLCSGEDG